MTTRQWIYGSFFAAMLVVAGMFLERALQDDDSLEASTAGVGVKALEKRNDVLSRELQTARQEAERWKKLAGDSARIPIPATADKAVAEPGGDLTPPVYRDGRAIRLDLDEAIRKGDGNRMLGLMAELASLGDSSYPELAKHWIKLTNMDAAALDRLGISRIDLASALVREEELIKFALDDADLDPVFRQFTAKTLEQAGVKVRRAILDGFDFSTEKDKRVLHPLVRAARDARDPMYVDRFLHLVQRTDLYNDSRSSIAFTIAEIEGPKSRHALDVLRATGKYKRMLPVLENIHSPPVTGLLVTNGLRPGANRIGHNDIILEYNGHPIRSRSDLTRADAKTKPGQIVAVKVFRGGVKDVLRITVTDTAPGHLHFDGRPIVKRR